jgi:hypothetical protein
VRPSGCCGGCLTASGAGPGRPWGRQRTDATHVLAAVRELNRLELVTETLRAVLEALAIAPTWLEGFVPDQWYERYGQRARDWRLPKAEAAREALAVIVGSDGVRAAGSGLRHQRASVAVAGPGGADPAPAVATAVAAARPSSSSGSAPPPHPGRAPPRSAHELVGAHVRLLRTLLATIADLDRALAAGLLGHTKARLLETLPRIGGDNLAQVVAEVGPILDRAGDVEHASAECGATPSPEPQARPRPSPSGGRPTPRPGRR